MTIKLPRTKQPKAGTVTEIKPGKPTSKVLSALQRLGELAPQKQSAKSAHSSAGGQSLEKDRLRIEELTKRNEEWRERYNEQQAKTQDLSKENDSLRALLSAIQKQLTYTADLIAKAGTLTEKSTPKEAGEAKPSTPKGVAPTKKYTPNEVEAVKDIHSGWGTPSPAIPSNSGELKTGTLGKCPMAILTFLASFPNRTWSKAQVGIATGYSPSSGGFNNALAELNTKGAISRDGGKLRAEGRAAGYLPAGFRPQTYSIETFKSKLGKCEREIYEAVLAQPDRWFTKPDLAFYTPSKYSPTSGGFNNALSTLNTLELIERRNGEVRLNPELLEI